VGWLIVGLGNPGAQYERTRHNIGFAVLDLLARRWGISFKEERRYQGLWAESSQKNYLLKPTTYMNRSGQSVRAALNWLKLPPEQLLVVYDELALPLGRLRLRPEGSAGGHNGMKSLIEQVGTQGFARLRLGIDAPFVGMETVNYVLGRFTPEQQQVLPLVVAAAADAVEMVTQKGLVPAMDTFNPWQP